MQCSVPPSLQRGPGLERGGLQVGRCSDGTVLTVVTRLSRPRSQLQLGSTPDAPRPTSPGPPWPGPERWGVGLGHGLSVPSKCWLQVEIRISAAALPPRQRRASIAVPAASSRDTALGAPD